MHTMKTYLVSRDGQQSGPFTLDELRAQVQAGRFRPGDHAWWEGATGWVRLDAVAELGLAPAAPTGLPPAAGSSSSHTSGTAIASLVFGLLALITGLSGLVGLPLGILALVRIRNGRGELTGSGLAIGGIACSSVGLLGVLLVLSLMPPLAQAKVKAERIKCVSNLRQVGLAFRIFANDNDDLYPWQTNKFPAATVNMPWQHFMAMSNELGTAKILLCPGDRQRLPNMAVDFTANPATGLLAKKNSAVSYTVGVNATEELPEVPLSHDRNVGRSSSGNPRIAPYSEGLNEVTFDALWVTGASGQSGHHGLNGNMALSDGSVMQQTVQGFQQSLRQGAASLRKPGRPEKQSVSMLFP